MNISFSNLLFLFFGAIVVCLGWHVGLMILSQLSHMLSKVLRYARSEKAWGARSL